MTTSTPGSETLLEAYALINGDRQADYGHPADDYAKVAAIFGALTGIEVTPADALLFMLAVKMARLRTNLANNQLHRDSLVDAMGYLGCLSMHLEREGMPGTSRHAGRWPYDSAQ